MMSREDRVLQLLRAHSLLRTYRSIPFALAVNAPRDMSSSHEVPPIEMTVYRVSIRPGWK